MKRNENSLLCEIHNSPIGGVCSDFNCKEPPFIMCIKCVVDPKSCIRKLNHKLIPLKEFIEILSVDKSFMNIKDIVKMYKQTITLNFNKVIDQINIHNNYKTNLFEELENILLDTLENLFSKEENLIKDSESLHYEKIKKSNQILADLQNEYKIYLNQISENNFNFEKFCNKLLEEINSNKISIKEVYNQVFYFISNFKKLMIESNNNKVFNAIDDMYHSANLISKPIERLKLELEKTSTYAIKDLTIDLDTYIEEIEREISDKIQTSVEKKTNLKNTKSTTESTKKKTSTFSNKILKSSNSGITFFKKCKIPEKEEKLIKSDKIKLFSTYTKSDKKLIPKESENKAQIINDEQVIIIDKFNYIVFSNQIGLFIYNFIKEKFIFSYKFQNAEECYQKKYINNNLKDYIFAIISSREIIQIFITDEVDVDFLFKIYKFPEMEIMTEPPFIFEINWAEEPLFGAQNLNPTLDIFTANSNSLQKSSIIGDNIKILTNHKIESEKFYKNIGKLEYFESNFNKITQINQSNSISTEEFLISQFKKYLAHNSGYKITIYETDFLFTPYYQICSQSPNNICHDFYIENLKSTNEAFIYSGWKNGMILIHSLQTKSLIKEIKSFNILSSPIYSICYVNEKCLLVGGENVIFLVNHFNEKAATHKWKDIKGKIISLKIFMSCSLNENFVSVSNDLAVYLWKNKNI